MNPVTITLHAKRRMQQRSISEDAIEFLLQFGNSSRSYGSEQIFFDKASRQRLKREADAETARKFERYMNAYAVISDAGVIITAGYRTKRFQKH